MELTRLQLLDKEVQDVLTEGGPSARNDPYDNVADACLYRGPNGRKCAAGWLIDDAHYDESLEGMTADRSDVVDALVASGVARQDIGFVRDLQRVHDGSALQEAHSDEKFIEEFKDRAKSFAVDHGLTYLL